MLLCGCSSKESPDDQAFNLPPPEDDIVVTTGDVEDNSTVNTNHEDVKYEPAVRKHEVTKEEQKPKKDLVSDNNVSKPVKVNEVVPKVEEKQKEKTKIESEKKEQITNTDEKENNLVEAEEKEPVKKEDPPKEQSKPINYKIGNSGKLFDTEHEADKEAERMFNDYSNPNKYISRYWIWSTYDKWTIEYEYTNWE